MKSKTATRDEQIIVTEVEEGSINVVLVGKTPLVLNRMSEKAKRTILLPPNRKTAADKASTLKHNPMEEYRASANRLENGPTLLAIPAAAPKRALAAAAIDLPGSAKKAQIGRLTWVPGEYLPVYGTQKFIMSVVRCADINRTPDIRTRAIVREWAIPMSINFIRPILNVTVILNLLSAAGLYIGIGDGRNEKGALNFGQFKVMSEAEAKSNRAVQTIMQQAREAQEQAFAEPEPYDPESAELMTWFDMQLQTRGKKDLAVVA